ncbi:holin [Tetzosporium hominis]|uniref:Holin n=1 Tax=Tetzosporium hominis TaxID=2020506 RepID=A0A264W1K4_9BACL|nr:phage holin family protein [Tetzosporium hominis]OZS77444.1 holin [Tetzosporium hominis]
MEYLLSAGGVNLEHLEIVRFYLFGQVKFLDLLFVLMIIDIATGVFKAIKNQNLWSRKSLFGYARKILIFLVIITANIVDQILGYNGFVAASAVIFYIYNETVSILENLAEVGVPVPKSLADKLKVMNEEVDNTKPPAAVVVEELTGVQVKTKKEGE